MHHDSLQISPFLAGPWWTRLTLGTTLGAVLVLTTLAHASEGSNGTRETDPPAVENIPEIETELDGSETRPSAEGLRSAHGEGASSEDTASKEEKSDSEHKEPANTYSPEATRGVLQIRSEPSGALVTVDGKRVGPTPSDHVTSIGHHRVEFTRPGYQPHTEDVVVGSEPGEPLVAKLDPVLQTTWKAPRWRSIFIGSLLGSGVGLIVSGGTLLGIHDQPPRRRCRAFSEDDCPFRYRTNVAGGILFGVGFVNIITGIVFTMYTNQYNRRMRNRPVQLRPTPTGMTIAF